jgi:hypothetical protein
MARVMCGDGSVMSVKSDEEAKALAFDLVDQGVEREVIVCLNSGRCEVMTMVDAVPEVVLAGSLKRVMQQLTPKGSRRKEYR